MPCYSSVTRTTMTDHDKLAEAMEALGWAVERSPNAVYCTKGRTSVNFSRRKAGDAFQTDSNIDVNPIQKKYSHIGVRQWAKSKGYSVLESDDDRVVLINRRR